LNTRTKSPTPRDRLSHEPVTSPSKKKSRTIFGSPINDSKEDEEQTYSNEIKGRGGKELDAIAMQGSIEEEFEPNLDQVIDNIQIELVVSTESIVSTIEHASANRIIPTYSTCSELVQIENPQFSRFQHVLIFGHSIETLRHINMFLEQLAQNATTWSRTLQEL
jgi:hypothetical protein